MSALVDIILKAQNQASGEIDEVTGSVNKLGSTSSDATTKGLTGLRNILTDGLKVAAIGATAALGGLTAAIAASTSQAAGMEQSLANIQANMGISSEKTAELKSLITDLGLDPNLKVSATEAAAAIDMLGRNGLSVDDILAGAAHSTVLLANSTGGDFANAADLATDIMAQFGIQAGDMGKVVDIIVGVVQNSKLTMDDFALAVSQSGGIAAGSGVEFEDFAAHIAATSHMFASGSDAGTSYKTFLQTLIPKSAAAGDMMRDLGLFTGLTRTEFEDQEGAIKKVQEKIQKLDPTSKNYQKRLAELNAEMDELKGGLVEGQNGFFDINGNMLDGIQVAQNLNTALAGLSESARLDALTEIFGADAARTALGMMQAAGEGMDAMKAKFAETSAIEAAAVRMDTFSGSLEIASGVIEALAIGVGEKFLPVFRPLIDQFSALASEHGPALIEWAGGLAESLGSLITYFTQIVATGSFVNDALAEMPAPMQKIMTVGGALLEFVTKTNRSFGDMAAIVLQLPEDYRSLALEVMKFVDPLLDIIDMVGDVVGKFISWQDILAGVSGAIIAAFIPAITALAAPVGAVLLLIGQITLAVGLMRTAWETDWGGIRSSLEAAWAAIQAVFDPFSEAIGQLVNTFTVKWGLLMDTNASLVAKLTAAWDFLKDAAQIAWDGVVAVISNLLPTFLENLATWAAASWEWVAGAVEKTVAELEKWGLALITWIVDNLPGFIEQLATWGKAIWSWIVDSVPDMIAGLGDWLGKIIGWFGARLPDFIATTMTWAAKLVDWIGGAVTGALDGLSNFLQNLRTRGDSEGGSQFGQMAAGWVTTLWRWIQDDLIPKIGPAFTKLVSAFASYYPDLLTSLGNLVAQLAMLLWKWIVDITPVALKKLSEWGSILWNWIAENKGAWGDKLAEWAETAWTWIRDIAIPEAVKKIAEWGEAIWTWVTDNADEWWDTLLTWSDKLWEWIIDEAWPKTKEQIGIWASNLWEWIKETGKEWYDRLVEWGKNVMGDIQIGFMQGLSDFQDWLNQNPFFAFIDQWLGLGFNKVFTTANNMGGETTWAFVDGTQTVLRETNWAGEEVARSFLDGVGTGLDAHSPSRKMWGYGEDAVAGLVNAVTGQLSNIEGLGKSMAKSLGNGLKSEAQYVAEQVKAMMDRANSEMLASITYFTNQAEIKAQAAHYKIANSVKDANAILAQLNTGKYVIGYGADGKPIYHTPGGNMPGGGVYKPPDHVGGQGTGPDPYYGSDLPPVEELGKMLHLMQSYLADVKGGMKAENSRFLNQIISLVRNSGSAMQNLVAPWYSRISAEGEVLGDELLDVIDTLKVALGGDIEAAKVTTIKDMLGDASASIEQSAITLLGGINLTATDLSVAGEAITSASKEAKKKVQDFVKGIGDFITGTLNRSGDISNSFATLWQKASDKGQSWEKWAASETGELRQTFREMFYKIRDQVVAIGGDPKGLLKALTPEGGEAAMARLSEAVNNIMKGINENTDFEPIQGLLQSVVDYRSIANKATPGLFDSVLPDDARLTGGSVVNTYNINLAASGNDRDSVQSTVDLLQALYGTSFA